MAKTTKWLVVALVILVAALEVAIATKQSLWIDEISSLAAATGHSLDQPATRTSPDLGDFVESNRPLTAKQWRRYVEHEPRFGFTSILRPLLFSDNHPPVYYFLLSAWTHLWGTSDLALRSLSILTILGCLPLLVILARRLGGEKVVLPAISLFAFSPLIIYYATEGRMYSLSIFLTVATATLSLILQQNGGKFGLYALWILASAAGLLTHYFFVFSWAPIVAWLFIRPGNFGRGKLISALVIVAAAIAPWYVAAFSFGHTSPSTLDWLHSRPDGFSRFRSIRLQFLRPFFPAGGSSLWPGEVWPARVSLAIFIALGLIAYLRAKKALFNEVSWLVWLWFTAACAAPIALDLKGHTYLSNHSRYSLNALPAACLLAALALGQLKAPLRFGCLALIFLAWSRPITNIYQLDARVDEPYRAIAKVTEENNGSNAFVLVHSTPAGVIGMARYTRDDTMIAAWVPELISKPAADFATNLVRGYQHVDLVKVRPLGLPFPEEDWLRAYGELLERQELGDSAEVSKFQLAGSAKF